MAKQHWLGVAVVAAIIVGCSNKPARVAAPTWAPEGFADAVLEKLDANKDGSVDKGELAGAPGLAWGAKYIDKDKNDALSRDELVARFTMYRDMKLAITSKPMQIRYKGRPVVGAKVELVPEFFLAGLVEPATGETDFEGTVDPQAAGLEFPGLRVGYYRMVVTSPKVKLPAAVGSAESTTTGVEVSPISDDASTYGTLQVTIQDK